MRHIRWPLFVTALVLAIGSAGCQMFGGGNPSTAGGPSRSFGRESVPRQSEPPLESDAGEKVRGAQTPEVKTASAKEPAVDEKAKRSNALTAFLAGRVPDPVPPQPFPVSARTASASESVAGSTD
jgi:hypothetical protein